MLASKSQLEARIKGLRDDLAHANEDMREGLAMRQGLERRLREAQKMEHVGRIAAGIAGEFGELFAVIGKQTGVMLVVIDNGRILERGSPRELIHRHVEPEVLEVRGTTGHVRTALDSVSDARIEAIGDIHYCYTRDARALLANLEQHPALTFLHRPTNLEDVFLKLTGHELRD